MEIHRTSKVFVPGGMPKLTYNPRSERGLEERLRQARDNLCKLVTVTGPTKSGKTVLTKKVFPSQKSIWVDGGTIRTEEDFWSYLLAELDAYTDSSIQNATSDETTFTGKGDVTAGLPLFAKVKGEFGAAYARQKGETSTTSIGQRPITKSG